MLLMFKWGRAGLGVALDLDDNQDRRVLFHPKAPSQVNRKDLNIWSDGGIPFVESSKTACIESP